jgi:hypothetical protein
MPWHTLPSLSRGDQLTADYLSRLRENIRFLQAGFEAEHLASGAHNAYQVPTAVLVFDGATVYGDSASIVSGAAESGGVLTFRVPKSTFPFNARVPNGGIAITACPIGSTAGGVKPIHSTATAASYDSTQVEITITTYQLSSSLGSGNTWTSADGKKKAVALHASRPRTRLGRYFKLPRGGAITTDAADSINGLVREIEDLYDVLVVEHSVAGVHAAQSEIFPRAAAIDYSGGAYAYVREWGATLGALTAPSNGRIYLANAGSATARARFVGDWASGDYAMSAAEQTARIWNAWDDGAGSRGAQCFYFDGSSWNTGRSAGLAHGQLFVAEHEL